LSTLNAIFLAFFSTSSNFNIEHIVAYAMDYFEYFESKLLPFDSDDGKINTIYSRDLHLIIELKGGRKMLKRFQVLLPDWLEDYIKFGAKKFDISVSELIRIEVCLAILTQITELFPEHKIGISFKELFMIYKNHAREMTDKEDIRRTISKIYYETRKAIEFRQKTQKK
jgi:hypothetical protein